MNRLIKKIVNSGKTKYFWAIIVLGALVTVFGVMIMPFWSKTNVKFLNTFGSKIINLMIAIVIVAYLLFYLIKKAKRARYQTILILTIIEFVLLAVIALGCVLTQFKVINVGGACQILGLALWCRGVVEVFRSYYYKQDSSYPYSLWNVVIAITMVTLGTYLFAKPLFSDVLLQWIFSIFTALCGVILIVIGIIRKPKKKIKS